MAQIESSIFVTGEAFQSNRSGMLALLERVRAYERKSVEKSEGSRGRFEKRKQLLPRERLSLLLDPGTPFLELSSLYDQCIRFGHRCGRLAAHGSGQATPRPRNLT